MVEEEEEGVFFDMDEKFDIVEFSHFWLNEPEGSRICNLRVRRYWFKHLTQEGYLLPGQENSCFLIWMKKLWLLSFHILDKMSLGGVELATFDYADLDLTK